MESMNVAPGVVVREGERVKEGPKLVRSATLQTSMQFFAEFGPVCVYWSNVEAR